MIWYKSDITQIFEYLATSENGLSTEEAKKRIKLYGFNKLPDSNKINIFKIILHQFTSPLIYILIISGVITFYLNEYIDSFVIFAVVILNALIGFPQELKAEKNVKALKEMLLPKVSIIRDGVANEINNHDIVPGDIVLLSSGMRVPADIRLIYTNELRIDESILTGESIPANKTDKTISEDNLTPGDQKNMAFMGTLIVSGRGKGVVVATGTSTEIGKIAKNLYEIESSQAPIKTKIEKFTKEIGTFIMLASLIIFFIGLIKGISVKTMFLTSIAVAVAAIPEGLPIVVTIALSVGVARMAKKNAIIRKLPAAETLGSTTIICSDKTGTLTKNEMTVQKVFSKNTVYDIKGSGYIPKGEILKDGKQVLLKEFDNLYLTFLVGALCNESTINIINDKPKITGDPTEVALIISAMKGGLKIDHLKSVFKLLYTIPFESEKGFMATFHKHNDTFFIFVKGSPEKIFELCSFHSELSQLEAIKTAETFSKDGMRVLAFAYKEISKNTAILYQTTGQSEYIHNELKELTFVGLQAMVDPPRPEAIEAIAGCRKAGIRVVMITGDHALTAKTIAKQLLIIIDEEEVLIGKDIENMNDDELLEKVKYINVYARVTPEHKLRIVNQLKRLGHIVAVTGDGVNDAPALKSAHIGVAMGKSGTDVAKEASDMVLTDDNFATIYKAVKEGRIVFENIRKVTFFLIPTALGSILSILGTLLMNIPIPLVPAQLLWINIVTNGLQDVSLAFEPGEKGIETRPPRKPEEPIMSKTLIERTFLIGILIALGVIYIFQHTLDKGYSIEKARTMAMTTMVFFQFFQAWNARSETVSIFKIDPLSNKFLFFSLIAATLAQLAVIYLPQLQWIFRTEPLNCNDWLLLLFISSSVVILVEVDKYLRKKLK
ncbi:MAG: HAD-IC family P-type ATPase [Calditerrivibrio sp.]|nr:HAD-IC family P-type ATPase [Calditerrivibrio sp.]